MHVRCFWLAAMWIALGGAFPMASAAEASELEKPLVVGTKLAEPFVIQEGETWSGISIELWEQMARDLGWEYEYRELPLPELIAQASRGELDLVVAAMTVTPEREQSLDFSHPFYSTGLGIAVPAQRSGALTLLRGFMSRSFLGVVSLLSLLLLGVGILVWLLERRRNASQFGGNALHGIGSGFWWSAVTMTTVGYGDKAPTTFGGRLLGLVWMFAGIIMISTFTAAITSSLTLTQLQSDIRGPEDLVHVRVGTLGDSAPETALRVRNVNVQRFRSLDDALLALQQGDLDAVVYDEPILRYQIRRDFQGILQVLPKTFDRQDYAIALPAGSRLREPLNRALLQALREHTWQELLGYYLGH